MSSETFADRLKELRGKRERTLAANGIGISRVALINYETGKRKPDIEILEKIADYYHVSADYLLGRTESKSADLEMRDISEKTGLSDEAIRILCEFKQKGFEFDKMNSLIMRTLNEIIIQHGSYWNGTSPLATNTVLEALARRIFCWRGKGYIKSKDGKRIDLKDINFVDPETDTDISLLDFSPTSYLNSQLQYACDEIQLDIKYNEDPDWLDELGFKMYEMVRARK